MNKKSGFWRRLVNQLWFVPAACVLGAILLAQLMVGLDRMIPPDSDSIWVDWVYAVGIDGSRSMLSAIGGSMLGVAATAFSITISVVATASSTYGPRLVRNFMADRINQVVLGVLVSTFIYTLLVLRTIRSASDDLASPFVPHIAVNFAVLLAIADVALLVYFIHHIADSVQVNTLAHGVRRRFLTVIERWYPEETPEEMTRTLSDRPGGELIRAEKTGYIVDMDFEKIRSCAEEKDLRVTMIPGVGDHILPGEPLFRVWPESLADDVEKTLRGSVALGGLEVRAARHPFRGTTGRGTGGARCPRGPTTRTQRSTPSRRWPPGSSPPYLDRYPETPWWSMASRASATGPSAPRKSWTCPSTRSVRTFQARWRWQKRSSIWRPGSRRPPFIRRLRTLHGST